MARYIDADKFDENKQYLRARLEFPDGTKTNGFWAVLPSLTIKDAPTEDVAPVVHSHWKQYEDVGYVFLECANCGLAWWLDEGTAEENEMNYCPKCGAKMDEKVE